MSIPCLQGSMIQKSPIALFSHDNTTSRAAGEKFTVGDEERCHGWRCLSCMYCVQCQFIICQHVKFTNPKNNLNSNRKKNIDGNCLLVYWLHVKLINLLASSSSLKHVSYGNCLLVGHRHEGVRTWGMEITCAGRSMPVPARGVARTGRGHGGSSSSSDRIIGNSEYGGGYSLRTRQLGIITFSFSQVEAVQEKIIKGTGG